MQQSSVAEEVSRRTAIFGHFSNHLKVGLIGLPNAGKSTIFTVLSRKQVPCEEYPFCTIGELEFKLEAKT